jgi:transposase
VFVV